MDKNDEEFVKAWNADRDKMFKDFEQHILDVFSGRCDPWWSLSRWRYEYRRIRGQSM